VKADDALRLLQRVCEKCLGVLPGRVRYSHLFGGAVLAGVGFTISLFITDLAFSDRVLRDDAKIGILGGSLVAALLGAWVLRVMGERTSRSPASSASSSKRRRSSAVLVSVVSIISRLA